MPGRTRAACRWGSLALSAAMLAASVGALARSAEDTLAVAAFLRRREQARALPKL